MMQTLITEMTLHYHFRSEMTSPEIHSSIMANEYLHKVWPTDLQLKESFLAIFLNKKNVILGFYTVSIGGTSETVVDPKFVIAPAILSNASSIIVAHNHPSGNTKPSQADRTITKRLQKAIDVMGMKLLDHIIVTESENNFYSFADNGDL